MIDLKRWDRFWKQFQAPARTAREFCDPIDKLCRKGKITQREYWDRTNKAREWLVSEYARLWEEYYEGKPHREGKPFPR